MEGVTMLCLVVFVLFSYYAGANWLQSSCLVRERCSLLHCGQLRYQVATEGWQKMQDMLRKRPAHAIKEHLSCSLHDLMLSCGGLSWSLLPRHSQYIDSMVLLFPSHPLSFSIQRQKSVRSAHTVWCHACPRRGLRSFLLSFAFFTHTSPFLSLVLIFFCNGESSVCHVGVCHLRMLRPGRFGHHGRERSRKVLHHTRPASRSP